MIPTPDPLMPVPTPALSLATPLAADRPLGPPGPPPSGERRARSARWRSQDVLRITALVTGYLIALALVWVARDIVFAAFLGVLFGLAVGTGAEQLTRFRIPRGLGAAIVVFGFLGAVYGVGAWIAPTLREQGAVLRERVPEAVDRIEVWVRAHPGAASLVLGGREVAAPQPTSPDSVQKAGPLEAAHVDGGSAGVPTLRQRLTDQLSGAARYLFPFLSSTVTVAAGLFLILVLAIYVGADPGLYHTGVMQLFPRPARARAGVVLSRLATVLRKWLVTQLVAMVTMGVVTTVVLALLDVKAAVALGVIAGLLEFVPTIGPILAALPAIAMGFLDSPEKALYVALAYLVIQQLEGHVLIPMLMKEGMDLPPALTVVTQAVMALLFGFLGLMVAVPLLAAVIVPVKLLYVEGVLGDPVYEDAEDG
jgi:predicted PurR-regulated permease PerM